MEIAAHLVYELDPTGSSCGWSRTRTTPLRRCARSPRPRRNSGDKWADPEGRSEVIRLLEERGISFEELAEVSQQPDADPFDLLCHLAFNAPLRTRRERAERLRHERKDFFDQYGPEARQILDELLEKYAEYGDCAVPASRRCSKCHPYRTTAAPGEIIQLFGGAHDLREAVTRSTESPLRAA